MELAREEAINAMNHKLKENQLIVAQIKEKVGEGVSVGGH